MSAVAITDEQIEALRSEAAAAGDLKQVAICDVALHGEDCLSDEEYDRLSAIDAQDVATLTCDRAREACAEAIAAGQG